MVEANIARLPYNEWDIADGLKESGWTIDAAATKKAQRESYSRDTITVLSKKFGQWKLEVHISHYVFETHLTVVLPVSKRWRQYSGEDSDKLAKMSFEMVDYTPTLEGLLREVNQRADKIVRGVKMLGKTQRQKKEFRWRGESGPQVRKQWRAKVVSVILALLRDYKTNGLSTSLILSEVLDNHMLEPDSMSSREAKAAVTSILKTMERDRVIESWSDGRRREKKWAIR
jgi:hypothetical protein